MKKLAVGLISVSVLTALFSLSTYLKKSRIEGALATGRLATLPATAHAVQVDTEGGLFAQSFWVVFEAPTGDIQHWVQESPALSKNQPCAYPQLLLLGEQPTWFRPVSIRKGLFYQILQDSYENYGTVWINWETNRVYIKTSHS